MSALRADRKEDQMQVICVDDTGTSEVQEGQEYTVIDSYGEFYVLEGVGLSHTFGPGMYKSRFRVKTSIAVFESLHHSCCERSRALRQMTSPVRDER